MGESKRVQTSLIILRSASGVIRSLRHVAIENAVAIQVGDVVVNHFGQIDRGEKIRLLGIEADAIDPADVDYRDVERLVLFVFGRAIPAAIARIEVEIAEVPGPADEGADQLPFEIGDSPLFSVGKELKCPATKDLKDARGGSRCP